MAKKVKKEKYIIVVHEKEERSHYTIGYLYDNVDTAILARFDGLRNGFHRFTYEFIDRLE